MKLGKIAAAMVAAGLAISAGLAVTAGPAAAAGIQTIYMKPGGSPTATGTTPEDGAGTLERVAQLIAAGPKDQDVEVRIMGGTYTALQTKWLTYRPGRSISFMPADYTVGGGATSFTQKPVFENARLAGSLRYGPGYWFYACPGGDLAAGGDSKLNFYYLQVQNYSSGGISLDGSGEDGCGGGYQATSGLGQPSARGLNRNTIFGMRFTSLGNAYTGGTCDTTSDFVRCGYGGVVLTESSNNRIENNHFINLRNSENSYIHAIYVTHKSWYNNFTRNNVTGVSSDPVKVRNTSNYNTFDSNVFGANDFYRTTTPGAAHYLEEIGTGQCASYHNRFTNNDLGTFLIASTANLPTWLIHPAGATYPGGTGCPALPAGEVRLTTAGNQY
ncbi:right-handed parallel beta-helix repeat-containing protein [Actinoplanes sp. NPDC024001]|uniref:right-handed parallel beta-helix repeat-containing protein n=1 Tax=Actinoplanes sp. NPDC024001 TaxID=3154598 RepID=UPI0033E08538